MKNNKTIISGTLLCLWPIILGVIVYGKLPEQIPIHWNSAGAVDNYAGKAIACFVAPAAMACLNLIVNIVVKNDPRRNNIDAFNFLGSWLIPVLTSIFVPFSILWALGYELPILKMLPLLLGVLIIICGNYLPKCRQNYTVGIRLPWTLHSEENWNKTHHMAGYLWIAGGIVLLIIGCFPGRSWNTILSMLLLIVLAVIPACYSFLLYKNKV